MGARAEFGRLLRQRREAAGLSQVELGRLVGYHHSQISKVEHGRRWPTRTLPARCDEVLGAGGELAAWWPSIEDEHRQSTLREQPAETFAVSSAGHPGPEALHEFEMLLLAYERFDDHLGGSGIVAPLESQLRVLMGWLADSDCRELHRIAAGYGYRAGWVRLEHGQHGLAMAWFDLALGWAQRAGDGGLAGDIQTRMGVIARADGDQVRALEYARAAEASGGGRPWIGFLAAILQARALASLGERARCEERLDHAEAQAARTVPADAPWLVGPHGVAMLLSTRAACYRDLAVLSGRRGLARRAVELAGAALDHTPSEMRPNRALFAARLADAHACAGDLEAAAVAVEPALTVPPSSRTALVVRELHGLRHRLLSHWVGETEIGVLLARISTVDLSGELGVF